MSFDLSRIRFDARKDFLGVVMQQGRVQLDADWNEWVAQLARRLQAGTLDTFGGSVVPRITPNGFLVKASAGALSIGPGRIYVDGVLAENHGGTPDAWEPQVAELNGTTALDYGAQPYYPDPPPLPTGGMHLAYLDVWQRDVTALQQPDLIEQAVGVDTTGRRQTVWQVKLLPNVGNIGCNTADQDIPGWQDATAASAARLSTATGDPGTDPDPCRVPPAAGYLGLENQTYRLEVHRGGAFGTATFKWSRDNATVASRVTHINPARDRVTVESIGRDDVLRFHDGDWVEVTDDWRELKGLPGELRRIRLGGGVDETARTLEFDSGLTGGLFPTDGQQATEPARNTRIRRWDQAGLVRRANGDVFQDLDSTGDDGVLIPTAGIQVFLEHGILIDFDLDAGGVEFHTGDHWVFAARSADASIELLDRAPPLGIHHHYARLSIVDFDQTPNRDTDCRKLWPPIFEGEGCDCTVCVSAEGHNNGTATLQQAIDSIKDNGGTVCLGTGTFNIAESLNIEGARSLRIRGQGWATLLVGTQPGNVVDVSGGTGVAMEHLTVIGSGASSGVTPMIAADNIVDLRVEHLNVLGLAFGDGTSVGIGLSGNVLGARISDCAIVAERGIANVSRGDRKYVLTGETRVTRNLIFCSQRAVSFDGLSLHYGNTRIADNLMLVGNQASIVARGAVLPGSPFGIADNVIYTAGDGIRGAVDGLAIEHNEITGFGERSGDGVVLEQGLDPVALDRVRITDNRISGLRGNAIGITHRVESVTVSGNQIEDIGLGACVMSGSGSAESLIFATNQCRRLGQAANLDNAAFAAIQLIRVEHADLLDNLIGDVALNAVAAPAVDALRAAAIGQLRVSGNRLHGIGPDRASGPVSAARLLPPFARLAIEANSIDRKGQSGQQPSIAEWRAINIAPDRINEANHFAAARFVMAKDAAFLFTDSHISALPVHRAHVSIRGNQLHGQLTGVPLNHCEAVDDCLFTDNHCEVAGDGGKEPLLGEFAAHTLNASNNRLLAQEKQDTLHLHPQKNERAIVIGNTSTGAIRVQNGNPVPDDLTLTNIIGI